MTRPDVSRYATYDRLAFEAHDNGVLLITLDNPEKLNATDGAMHDQLSQIGRAHV